MAPLSLRGLLHWALAGKESRRKSHTVPPNKSQGMMLTLTDLPMEILRALADIMPTEDAVSFALSVRKMYENMAPKVFTRLVHDDQARTEFLNAYRRDRSPQLISCAVCHSLHAVPQRESGDRLIDREKRKCGDVENDEQSNVYFHDRFESGDVQVLAEISRRSVLATLKTSRQQYARQLTAYIKQTASRGRSRYLGSFVYDFQVTVGTDGDVYVRKQEWFVVASDKNKFTSSFIKQDLYSWTVYGHLSSGNLWQQHADETEAAEKALRGLKVQGALSDAAEDPGSSTLSMTVNPDCTWAHLPLHQCRHCPTEYRLDVGAVSDSLLGVVLTKWMQLGKGQSRGSGIWPKHLESKSYGSLPTPYAFEPGSIMVAFEGAGDEHRHQPKWHSGLEQSEHGPQQISTVRMLSLLLVAIVVFIGLNWAALRLQGRI